MAITSNCRSGLTLNGLLIRPCQCGSLTNGWLAGWLDTSKSVQFTLASLFYFLPSFSYQMFLQVWLVAVVIAGAIFCNEGSSQFGLIDLAACFTSGGATIC